MKFLFCVYYLQEIHSNALFDGHVIIYRRCYILKAQIMPSNNECLEFPILY